MSLLCPFPSASWSQKSIFLPVNVVMLLVGQLWCCWVCISQYATAAVWRTYNLFTSGCHGKRSTTRQNRSIYGNPWVRRVCRASSNWSPALWTEAHRQCPACRVKYQVMATHTVGLVLAPRKHFWGWKKPIIISYYKNILLATNCHSSNLKRRNNCLLNEQPWLQHNSLVYLVDWSWERIFINIIYFFNW